jgi:hypothetical protein
MDKKCQYTSEEIEAQFHDVLLPSPTKQAHGHNSAHGTFMMWPASDDECDGEGDAVRTTNASLMTRLSIFARGAQPLYPPFIYTKSDIDALRGNIGRVIAVFRQIPKMYKMYTFERYVRIVTVDVVSARSNALKSFIFKKIKAGGLRRERTAEEWAATFEVDWYKVSLVPFDECEINPMEVKDVRSFLEGLQG